jgi:hypothetical protein
VCRYVFPLFNSHDPRPGDGRITINPPVSAHRHVRMSALIGRQQTGPQLFGKSSNDRLGHRRTRVPRTLTGARVPLPGIGWWSHPPAILTPGGCDGDGPPWAGPSPSSARSAPAAEAASKPPRGRRGRDVAAPLLEPL